MSRRSKRASMREGPLSDLFGRLLRTRADDRPAGPVAEAGLVVLASCGRGTQPHATRWRCPIGHGKGPESSSLDELHSSEPALKSRRRLLRSGLKRVFSEEPRHTRREIEPVVEAPRYGREEPEYEPPGSGEPHQPVIRVVGVGGGGVNAVNRMVEARIPGVEFMAVNTDLQSLQLCVADVTFTSVTSRRGGLAPAPILSLVIVPPSRNRTKSSACSRAPTWSSSPPAPAAARELAPLR